MHIALFTTGRVVYDNFDRANSPSSLGAADSGEAWQVISGAWGITGGKAYETNTSGGDRVAVVDGKTGTGFTVSVDVTWQTGGSAGLSFRVGDSSNRYYFIINGSGGLSLGKIVAGSNTSLGGASLGAVSGSTYTLSVTYAGDAITARVNGVQRIAASSSDLAMNTKHGMVKNAALDTIQFDRFKMEGS